MNKYIFTNRDRENQMKAFYANLELEVQNSKRNKQLVDEYNMFMNPNPVNPLQSQLTDTRDVLDKANDILAFRDEINHMLYPIIRGAGSAYQISQLLTPSQLVFVYRQINKITDDIRTNWNGNIPVSAFMEYIARSMSAFRLNSGIPIPVQFDLNNQLVDTTIALQTVLQPIQAEIEALRATVASIHLPAVQQYVTHFTELLPSQTVLQTSASHVPNDQITNYVQTLSELIDALPSLEDIRRTVNEATTEITDTIRETAERQLEEMLMPQNSVVEDLIAIQRDGGASSSTLNALETFYETTNVNIAFSNPNLYSNDNTNVGYPDDWNGYSLQEKEDYLKRRYPLEQQREWGDYTASNSITDNSNSITENSNTGNVKDAGTTNIKDLPKNRLIELIIQNKAKFGDGNEFAMLDDAQLKSRLKKQKTADLREIALRLEGRVNMDSISQADTNIPVARRLDINPEHLGTISLQRKEREKLPVTETPLSKAITDRMKYVRPEPTQDDEEDNNDDWIDENFHTPSGKGLSRSKKFAQKYGKQMEKPKPYVPFGRYMIHKHQLQNNVLQLKYPSGASIGGLKTKPISEAESNIYKKTIDGTGVSFSDIEDLQPDERNNVHHILTKSQIPHSITKTKEARKTADEDKQKLHIYIGEIEAGNDSPQLLRELKTLVVKMLREKRVSKQYADAIIYELTEKGI